MVANAQLTNRVLLNPMASSCGLHNGSIQVNINYGTGPWLIFIDSSLTGSGFVGLPVSVTTNTYTYNNLLGSSVAPGRTYRFRVIDFSSDQQDASVPLGDLSVSMTAASQPTGCMDTSGRIMMSTTQGWPPFQFSITDGTNTKNSPDSIFGGLPHGNYTATVKDGNGCVVSQPLSVAVINDISVVVGTPPPICSGDSVQLPVLSQGSTYTWTPTTFLSDPNSAAPWAKPPAGNQTYQVSVSAGPAGLCTPRQAQVTVTVNQSPVADAGPDLATCTGKNVILRGTGAGAGGKYTWSPSTYLINPNIPSPALVKPTQSISYTLSVTAANGCVSKVPDTVHVTVIPSFAVNAGSDTIVYMGEPAQLHATVPDSLGAVTWQWTPSLGLDNPTSADPTFVLNNAGEVQFVVEATTAGGCSGTDTVNIKVFGVAGLFVPNAFTPNNDGHNDILRVIGPGIGKLVVFAVYDRWGRQVFLTRNAAVGWDGTFGGRAMDAGTYVWMAEAVDDHGKVVQKKGTVVLIR